MADVIIVYQVLLYSTTRDVIHSTYFASLFTVFASSPSPLSLAFICCLANEINSVENDHEKNPTAKIHSMPIDGAYLSRTT